MKQKTIRRRSKKVKISSTAKGLTSQAGLIPVIKYLEKICFEETVKRVIPHPRGDNADYRLADVMLLTIIRNTRRGQSDGGLGGWRIAECGWLVDDSG